MNPTLRFVVSLFALSGLLAGAATQAQTSLATKPLKVAVFAKPTVVFAMDDSGSMDAEVMIDGAEQGWAWFSTSSTSFFVGGKPRDGSGSGEIRLFYLFPNGKATGARVYSDSSPWSDGLGIPPIPQNAWTRSAKFNSIYYDSTKTYTPWAPAWLSGTTLTTFGNASITAAKSHPVLGTGTFRLDADQTATTTDWRFTFTAGMTIPTGATSISCSSGSAGALPYTVTTTNKRCIAAVPYYPATFWHAENCGTINTTTCVYGPDGTTKLKKYEIKSATASYPSGRSYADEMQNFANWFTYYRKRRLLLAAAMGNVLEDMTGLRMGVVAFNNQTSPTMYDADDNDVTKGRFAVSGIFYKNEGDKSTPTHGTMGYVANQFDTNTNLVKYACQRNAMFVLTDGLANDSATSPSGYASGYSQATYGGTTPYKTTASKSLADKALAYFTARLRASGTTALPAGQVPLGDQTVQNKDPNPNLHINTYALTLGMKGTIWPSTVDPFVTAPTWPTPVSDTPTMIDDLWHATINGRGQMFLATKADEAADGIRAALIDILKGTGAQSGVGVSSVNLARGDSRAYVGGYNPSGWSGDLTAQPIDPATGVVTSGAAASYWSAGSQLLARNWTTRQILSSSNGSSATVFSAAAVGSTVNPSGTYGTTADVINYLRGDRSKENGTFRTRTSLLGAVISSEPVVDRVSNVVYVQSNEGMLHAFDTTPATGGIELWAFVPNAALGTIGQTVQRGFVYQSLLDGPITVDTSGTGKKLLVAGMGVGGKSYYAIDVSNPRSITESALPSVWQFPAAGDTTTAAKVGKTLGKARIVKTAANGYVVLVTSGYATGGDGKGRMWMLNASTGATIAEFATTDGSATVEAGLAHISPYVENTGNVQYVYGGDLLGNVWRFDLVNHANASLKVVKVATLKNGAGQTQPITAAPELTKIDNQRVVVVGTGRILDVGDFANSEVQSVYAIADGSTLSNARSSLVAQTYSGDTTISGNPVDWTTQRGWYVDLPSGEKVNTTPSVAYGAVAFVSNRNGATDCSASSKFYVLDLKTGGKFAGIDFVSSTISTAANSSAVAALATSTGKIVGAGQDNNGNPWKRDIATAATISPAKNSWREVRRD
jgi:type IV pilus assembly protein PilY1